MCVRKQADAHVEDDAHVEGVSFFSGVNFQLFNSAYSRQEHLGSPSKGKLVKILKMDKVIEIPPS